MKRLAIGDGFIACDVHGTTDSADELADDLEHWAINELGYQKKDDGILAYTYASEIEFQLSASQANFAKSLEQIGRMIGNLVRSYGNESPDFNLDRVNFVADPQINQTLRTLPFVIERRVGLPHVKEVWYSAAPLRTNDHIAVLQTYSSLFEGAS